MNGNDALRTALALARQRLDPATPFTLKMITDGSNPPRKPGEFRFTMTLDRPGGERRDDLDE